MLKWAIAFVSLLSILALVTPINAAASMTGKNHITISISAKVSQLEIPSINLEVPIVVAHFIGNSWDFSNLNTVAGFFEGLPMPGDGSNAVIGAHSELDNRSPGPFYNLNHVKINDQIIVIKDGVTYIYIVTKIWYVPPTDVSPLSETQSDALTLFTCAGYDQGVYTMRLVVRAELRR